MERFLAPGRRGPGDIVLTLLQEPPRRLVVERLNMEEEGIRFRGKDGLLDRLEFSFLLKIPDARPLSQWGVAAPGVVYWLGRLLFRCTSVLP
jgi:hypothetical protein